MTSASKDFLFGGDKPWDPLQWTSSDDRVRGGSSYSELTCNPFSPLAIFRGNLDIKTLGGAGFASQRTTGEDRNWDVSKHDGLVIDIAKSDGKKYTLILKDSLLPRSPNGREQSTISWEFDFTAGKDDCKVFVRWGDFKPTYRGRTKKDAKPLDLMHVKRISLMMRSFFGTQEGDFSLSIRSISVFKSPPPSTCESYQGGSADHERPGFRDEKKEEKADGKLDAAKPGWLGWFFGRCSR